MQVNIQERINNPAFGKFIRVSGRPHRLKHFRQKLRENSNEFLSFIKKKDEKKSYLYIITGKDLDKFIDLMREIPHFFKLRHNPEKYLNKEPKKYKLIEAEKKFLGNKKFNF